MQQSGLPGSPGGVDGLLQTRAPPPGPAAPAHQIVPRPISTLPPADAREELWRTLGRLLVLPVPGDARYRAPIITLASCELGSVYSGVVERHISPEWLAGPERFWKAIRADRALETWRPRVHGAQLKALSNARLPESPEEVESVKAGVAAMPLGVLREGSTADMFAADLERFVSSTEAWWDNRNKRQAVANGYLAPSSSSAPAKRQAIVAVQRGPGPTVQYGSSSSEMILPGMTKKECIGGLGSPTASGPGGLGPLPGLPFLPGPEGHEAVGGQGMGAGLPVPQHSPGLHRSFTPFSSDGNGLSSQRAGSGAAAMLAGIPRLASSASIPSDWSFGLGQLEQMEQQHHQQQQQQQQQRQQQQHALLRRSPPGVPLSNGMALPSPPQGNAGPACGKESPTAHALAQQWPNGVSLAQLGCSSSHQHTLMNATVVQLNVGGQPYTSSTETLSAVPGSLLERWFGGLVPEGENRSRHELGEDGEADGEGGPGIRMPPLARTSAGECFIDRDGELFRYVLAYLRDVVTTQRECRRPSAQQQHQGDQHHLRPQQQQATGMDGSLPGCSHRRAAAAGSTAANDTSMPASTRPLEAHNTSQAHHGTSAAHEVSLQNGYSGQGPSGQGQGGALRVQQGAVGRGRGQSKYLLPQTSSELGALEREAVFYGLPELAATCTAAQQHTGITSSNSLGIGIGLPGALMEERGMTCSQQYVYDSLYLETGFSSIEGTGLREMEARKTVVMQQMNHVLQQRAADGFEVAACGCGAHHRDVPAPQDSSVSLPGGVPCLLQEGSLSKGTGRQLLQLQQQHNLYYHILLRKPLHQ